MRVILYFFLDRKKILCSLLMKLVMCLFRYLFNDYLLCMLKSYSKSFENKKFVEIFKNKEKYVYIVVFFNRRDNNII